MKTMWIGSDKGGRRTKSRTKKETLAMNLILVVSDTFRKDHLGFYGNKVVRTPNLDKLASRSTVFENHYAGSFPTMPARADLFTGKYTFTYMGWEALLPGENTLAMRLKEAGYVTTAFVDTPFYIRKNKNYDIGFDTFCFEPGQEQTYGENRLNREQWCSEVDRCAPRTILNAEKWLDIMYDKYHRNRPFFMLIDMWDPHHPYDAPVWYSRLYNPSYDRQPCLDQCKQRWPVVRGMTEEKVKTAHACYCGEITMVDRLLGHLMETLELMELTDNTAIIFTSDHGFYFGEHGGMFCKIMRAVRDDGTVDDSIWIRTPLYEEICGIPLVIYVPAAEHRRIEGLTSAVDIMPTLLELAGAPLPKNMNGSSLVPVLQGKDYAGHEFVVTSAPLQNAGEISQMEDDIGRMIHSAQMATLRTEEWSFLYSVAGEPAELYHLPTDPRQAKNLVDGERDMTEKLHKTYVNFLKSNNIRKELLAVRDHL